MSAEATSLSRFVWISEAIMHVLPRPGCQDIISKKDSCLTHCIGEDTALRHGLRYRESEAQLAAVWIPVELSAGVDVIVIVLDLDWVIIVFALSGKRICRCQIRTQTQNGTYSSQSG